jgi:hypothetical protein
MDRFASLASELVDPLSAAASLQNDFAELVRIFDRELIKTRADTSVRSHIAEARQAAERGLGLSNQLAGLLQHGENPER